jgi:hypothetical protein
MDDYAGSSTCTGTPASNGGGYQPVPGTSGEVTINVLWTPVTGRSAPTLALYSASSFSLIHQFEPDTRYCYTVTT